MQGEQEFQRAVRLLPPNLRDLALKASQGAQGVSESAEEIRLRAGKRMSFVVGGKEVETAADHAVTAGELQFVLEIATRASAHTYADSIRMGYVTAEGGCRIGLCGTAVAENDVVTAMRRISSICIRIPREKRGCADGVFDEIAAKGFKSTIIISPPGAGKTTLLREITRLISDGGTRVSLVDERNEVAGTFEGNAAFDVGRHTDVLAGAPKSAGVMMALRAMSPQVIAFDEITAAADVEAAFLAANCGVEILATAHAASSGDLMRRPLYRKMLEDGLFEKAVVILSDGGKRKYKVETL